MLFFSHKNVEKHKTKKQGTWDFPCSPIVKTPCSTQGAWVRSLLSELRSHMVAARPKKKKKKARYPMKLRLLCNNKVNGTECFPLILLHSELYTHWHLTFQVEGRRNHSKGQPVTLGTLSPFSVQVGQEKENMNSKTFVYNYKI